MSLLPWTMPHLSWYGLYERQVWFWSVFKMLNWSKLGIKENGKYLSHLRFADNIYLMAGNLDQAQAMLQHLNEEPSKFDLTMNLSKTKVMTNIDDDRDIKIGDTVIERVDSYV